MDKHNVGRGRESVKSALRSIKAKALVISISSDILFPVNEQELLAAHIPHAELAIIDSYYGHDGFLLEYEQLSQLIQDFLEQNKKLNFTTVTTK